MSRSTKDDAQFTENEFSLLTDIVKRIPDQHRTAVLQDVVRPYQSVLLDRNIDVDGDEHYWGCVMRLVLYQGRSWREKLLNAIPPTKTHRRYRSDTVNGPGLDRRDGASRSAVRQRLDREFLPRTPRSQSPALEPPELTAEHKNALVGRYKVYMRSQAQRIMHRVMQYWNEAAMEMHNFRREQRSYAIAADHDTLKRQAVEIWYRAWYDNVEFYAIQERKADLLFKNKFFRRWENKTIERKQGQYLAKVAAEKRAQHHAMYRIVQEKLLGRFMHRWQAALTRDDERMGQATELYSQHLQARYWKRWFFRACDRRTIEYRNATTTKQAFEHWRVRSRVHTSQMDHAVEHHNMLVLDNAISHWQILYANKEAARGVAIYRDSTRVTSNALTIWQRTAVLHRREGKINANVISRLLRHSMIVWWEKFVDREEQQERAKTLRLKMLFRAWRREALAASCIARHDEKVLSTVIKTWQLQTKGIQVRQSCTLNMVYRCMSKWRRCTGVTQRRLEIAETVIKKRQDCKLFIQVLDKLGDRLDRLAEMAIIADDTYAKTILKFAFFRMREALDENQFQVQRAVRLDKQFTQRRFMRVWQAEMYSKRERDQQEKLENILVRRDDATLRHVLHKWHARYTHHLDVAAIADHHYQERITSQLRYFFTAWCDRHQDLFEMYRVAAELEQTSLAKSLCDRLLTIHVKRKQDRDTASIFYANRICLPAITNSLQRWYVAYQRLQEKEERAAFMAEQSERRNRNRLRSSLRHTLRHWRSRTAEAQGHISSGSFNVHDTTLVPWSSPTKSSYL